MSAYLGPRKANDEDWEPGSDSTRVLDGLAHV